MSNEKERLPQARPTIREAIKPATEQPVLPASSGPDPKMREMETMKPQPRKAEPDIMQVLQQLTRERVVEGVLMSEILGKPLALRRRHPRQ